MLAAHGIRSSVSRVGGLLGRGRRGSFFATRKTEVVVDADWPARL